MHDDPVDPAADSRLARAPALAAVERASHHLRRPPSTRAVLEHLALAPRSGAARAARAGLEAARERGLLERTRRHGRAVWRITDSGTRELARLRGTGLTEPLPESPQHRAWRDARTSAEQEIERFREQLRVRLREATALLDAPAAPHSDAWLVLGEQLRRDCRRLGSASHCLREWREPDDEHADVDEHLEAHDDELEPAQRTRRRALRTGRRNLALWRDYRDC